MPINKAVWQTYVVVVVLALAVLMAGAVFFSSDIRQSIGFRSQTGRNAEKSQRPQIAVAIEAPPRPASDYLGSNACVDCHAEIVRRYANHPMRNSLFPTADATRVEQIEGIARFSAGPHTTYEVICSGEGMVHRESAVDSEGLPLYSQEVEIDYILGSGRRGRSYLHRRDGFVFLSPVSWYTQKRVWDLSPEYEPEQHLRFERSANDRCLQCHAGLLNYRDEPTTALSQPYGEPAFLEAGIGCERCHGPGKAHVDWHTSAANRAAGSSMLDPIVQIGKLAPDRRDAVCNQCHLTGESQILRYGRRHGDFRPGDRIGDIWTVFVSPGDSGDALAVSHVQQMHASRCFQASGGAVGCISCHDPHALPDEEAKHEHYRQRCNACHQDQACSLPPADQNQAPAHGSCIVCHMPPTPAKDVPHTTQTDHRVRKRPANSTMITGPLLDSKTTISASRPADTWKIFDGDEVPLGTAEHDRAWGIMLAKQAESNRDPDTASRALKLLEPVLSQFPRDIDILDSLGIAKAMQDRPREAVEHWLAVLTIEPNRREALLSLMDLAQQRGDLRQAALYGTRLLKVQPWDDVVHFRMAELSQRLGRRGEARRHIQRAIELNPTRPEYCSLALAYLGDQAESGELERLRRCLSTFSREERQPK